MALAKTNIGIYETDASKVLNMQIVSAGNTNTPIGITYGAGYYAFVGSGEESIQYSVDGKSFDTAIIDFVAYDIIYSESKSAFIIAGCKKVGNQYYPVIASTVNFSSFTKHVDSSALVDNMAQYRAIIEINNRFLILAYGYVNSNQAVFKAVYDNSFNLVSSTTFPGNMSWTNSRTVKSENKILLFATGDDSANSSYHKIFVLSVSGGSSVDAYGKVSLGYANGYFFRYDKRAAGTLLQYSIDGLTWNDLINNTSIKQTWDSVVYLNGEYLFIRSGEICRRTDIGITLNDTYESVPGLPKTGPGVVANEAAYLMGSNLIRLSADIPDPTVEAERLSATQALQLSKAYADQLFTALDARVRALEGN